MRSSVLIALLAGAAAVGAAGSGVRADADATHELVVYVGSPNADLASVRTACRAETGLAAPDEESDLAADGAPGVGRALVYRMHGASDRDAKRGAKRIARQRWVTDAFVTRPRRTRGAPVQIPVIEGDLEPRVIRDQPAMAQVTLDQTPPPGISGGVLVAVLDGGFDLRHECLAWRVGGTPWDALDGDADPQDLGDGVDGDEDGTTDRIVGHGTFVASLILAAASDARILPIRVLDDEGWGTPLAVAKAIRHAVDQRAAVINMSLVVPTTTPMVRDAVRAALDAGVVVVSAAGNQRSWQNDPRLARRVITVGALNRRGDVAPFSVTGSHVHVYAPGIAIRGARGGAQANDYATWRGTSFAAPFVAATAAIVRRVAPSLGPEAVRQAVTDTAVTLRNARTAGRGRLDAAAACEAASRK